MTNVNVHVAALPCLFIVLTFVPDKIRHRRFKTFKQHRRKKKCKKYYQDNSEATSTLKILKHTSVWIYIRYPSGKEPVESICKEEAIL